MNITPAVWGVTLGIMLAVLAIDVFVIGRRPHEPSMREASIAIVVYIVLAIAFGIGVGVYTGSRYAGEFFAGYLTEYSLSVDNLFVFIIIMANMRVPRQLQQFALMVGIILALIFRGAFIALGAAAISAFTWVFFLFGAFLVLTAFKLVKDFAEPESDEEQTENWFMRWVERTFPSSSEFDGTRVITKPDGKRLLTPMAFVILALGSTDLLFALDSIPAIYGLTQEPYLVFAANVFALMGLRQLYFLIGGLLKRLVYLSLGLAVILAFIGVKLVLHAVHEYGWDESIGLSLDIPTWLSLVVILVSLLLTTVASLWKSRRDARDGLE